MNARSRAFAIVSWAAVWLAGGTAGAQILIQDAFTDGDLTNGADPYDVAWFRATAEPALSVSELAGAGTGNSLLFDSSGTFRRTYAPFTESLLSIGDTLTLSFNVYVVSVPSNNTAAFRFGLFNQETDFIDADGQDGRTANDFGWANQMGIGVNGIVIGSEPAGNTILGGASPSGISSIPGATTTPSNLGVGVNYSLVYTIERLNASSGIAKIFLDSIEIASGTRTGLTDADFTFDLLAVGTGSTVVDMRLDNVSLAAVPEPTSVALAAVAVGLLALRRRR